MAAIELYLVRHAIAAARGAEWPDDRRRPLTDRGRAKFKRATAGLKGLGLTMDEVLTSPLLRARQTAELLAGGLAECPPVGTLEALAPGHSPSQLISGLARLEGRRRLALVGHEPGLGELAAFLTGSRRAIPLRKGGVCRIDVHHPLGRACGVLVWLVTPRILKRLAP
jgi:phosphohistidine phosphatase